MRHFIARHKPDWEELAALVERARKSAKRLTPTEISRLDELYRQTCVHLSQVSSRTRDQKLIRYLNDLTASAHSIIYVSPGKKVPAGVAQFFISGFARAIARTWRYQVVSLFLTLFGFFLAYFTAAHDVLAAYALLPAGDIRTPGATKEQLLEVLRSGRESGGGTKFQFASFLFSHNLKVGLLAIGVGVIVGLPTVLLLIYNGMVLGAFAHMHHAAEIYAEFWAWILPHGITEIGAIVLCGGVGLMLGDAVVRPGMTTRSDALRLVAGDAAKVTLGIAVMLLFAAIIESYLRQSHLSTTARMVFAASTGIFWVVYIRVGFQLERQAATDAETA